MIFDGSPTTLPSGADGLEGPPPTKFYELRDNLELLAAADKKGPVGVGSHVLSLAVAIRQSLAAADRADLLDDFNTVVTLRPDDPRAADVECAVLLGWLRGVIEAQSLEARIQADAKAYAEERVKAERPVGFAAPPDQPPA